MSQTADRSESIFAAAVALATTDERTAYLDKLCAGDPSLRARIEALLLAHERSRHLLDKPAVGDGDQTKSFSASGEDAGTIIAGRYKLLEQIAEGGMGTVWLAEQVQPVRRKVALKLIKPGMDSKTVLSRFEAERQALAMMDHPNIAKVLDGGTTQNGRPFFVMEYVKGVPITNYCDDARLSIPQRLQLFVPVCQAVQHAHQKGIIHRDLKPSNILICMYDGQPIPKVIDFGLAKAMHQPLTDHTLHTAHGIMLGTPLYMSPEQAEFNNLDVDTRTDVYALGVILYELLTGTTPLERQRFKEAALQEMLRLIKEEDPPRPSARLSGSGPLPSVAAQRQLEPIKLAKLVQGELDWIVMKCLEKNRSRRYETANGLARDVERYLADESVEACPPSASYRLRKFARKHRAALTTAVIIVVLLAAGIAVSSWQAVRARRAEIVARMTQLQVAKERDKAVAARQRADQEASIASAVSNFLQNDLLAEAAPENNARAMKVTVEEVLRRASERIDGQFEQQPQVEAAIRMTIADTFQRLGDEKAAQPHLERALLLRRQVLGPEHPESLECMNSLGCLYLEQGQLKRAEELLVETLNLRRRVLGDEDLMTLQSMNSLANLYQDQDRFSEAEPLLLQAVEVSRRKLGEAHFRTLLNMNSLALLYKQQGKLDKAEPMYVQILELRRKVLGNNNPYTLVSMNNLAILYQAKKEFARAEPLMIESLDASRRVLGNDHPDTIHTVKNLAWLYQDWGKLNKAESLFREALSTTKKLPGQERQYATTAMGLGETLLKQQKFAEAESVLRDCLAVQLQRAPQAWNTSLSKALLGHSLLGLKQYSEAEELLLAGYQGMKNRENQNSAEESSELLEVRQHLAELYDAIGKQDEATKWRPQIEERKKK